jgi:hypothetical protein
LPKIVIYKLFNLYINDQFMQIGRYFEVNHRINHFVIYKNDDQSMGACKHWVQFGNGYCLHKVYKVEKLLYAMHDWHSTVRN